MKPINKRLLIRYFLINIAVSSFLVLILWYTGRFIEGVLYKIGLVLYLPSFYILVFLLGLNETMHFTTDNTELFVSFIFYSLLIALIQFFIYKRRKKKQEN